MIRVIVDGIEVEVAEGTTALSALRQAGLDVPTACDDPRLEAIGACRLCLVRVEGMGKLQTSCTLKATDGMRLTVRSPELDKARRDGLNLLARDYPAELVEQMPDKPFHKWLHAYGVEAGGSLAHRTTPCDDTNPYFRYDPEACIQCFRCERICAEVQGSFVWYVVGRGKANRLVPDSMTTLDFSACKSCGACSDACPTAALADKERLDKGQPETWTRTTCPYCGVGCEMEVGVRQDRIVQVKPAMDAPVNKGHLCVKGRYAHGFVHAKDRATTPMIRRDGVWQEASWDEAIGYVASKFQTILDESGPDAIGVLGSARAPNEDNYMVQKFARAVLGTNNVDCCARVCHGPTAAAMKASLGTGAATNSYDDLEMAKTIFVIGSNPTENHPIVGVRILQAKLKGANLIVADPRRTELAGLADVHVALRPGTNVPFLNAMGRIILEEGLADAEFLAMRVEQVEAYREAVEPWTPEHAAEVCGVEAETIRAAARLYASTKPSMCFHGLGMTEHLQGTEGVMALVNLALLTGNLGIRGAGINPLRGQNNVQGSAHMGCEPSNLTGFVSVAEGRERFEQVWGTELTDRKGMNLVGMMDAAREGRLRALWAVGYDIYLTLAAESDTRKAMESIELVVVQDLFLNETAKAFGHVFLPACSSFERDGTFMNAERRVQRVRKAVSPVGDSKPDWEIVQDVARAMGAPGFSFASAAEIWDEVRKVWTPGAGMSYERLEKGGLQWPCPTEDHPGTQVLHKEKFPIGVRAALKPIVYTPTPERVNAEFPFLLNTGRTLYQFNAGTMTDRTPNHRLRPSDTLDMHPSDASRLGLADGEEVWVVSRHGRARLPVRLDTRVVEGQLFATFHSPEVFLNRTTSPVRDTVVGAPEYKVTAVRVTPVARVT